MATSGDWYKAVASGVNSWHTFRVGSLAAAPARDLQLLKSGQCSSCGAPRLPARRLSLQSCPCKALYAVNPPRTGSLYMVLSL